MNILKKTLNLIVLLTLSTQAQIVKDTLYTNDYYGRSVDRESVEEKYFIVIDKGGKEDGEIAIYEKQGNRLIGKGIGHLENNRLVYQGELVINPYKKNKPIVFYHGENGVLERVKTSDFFTDKEYVMEFKNKDPFHGEVVYSEGSSVIYTKLIQGKYTKTIEVNQADKDNYQVGIYNEEGSLVKKEYVDKQKGIYYEVTYKDCCPVDGTDVGLLKYRGFIVDNVQTYKAGEVVAGESFYSNGQVKQKTEIIGTEKIEETFDKQGNLLGTYRHSFSGDQLIIQREGTYYYFGYGEDRDRITEIMVYKDNKRVKREEVLSQIRGGIHKSVTYYNEYEGIDKIVYYDKENQLISTLNYQHYSPYQGTEYTDNEIVTYQNGKKTDYTKFYYLNNQVFEQHIGNQSTFYDKQGNVIGKASYHIDERGRYKAYSGTVYEIYLNALLNQYRYKDGVLEYRGEYQRNSEESNEDYLKEEVFLVNGIKSKEVQYHKKSHKPKKISYYIPSGSSYRLDRVISYDQEGKEIGTYNYQTKTGTKVLYYTDVDVRSIEKYEDDKLLHRKYYSPKEGNTILFGDDLNAGYYLQSEIDYFKEGTFYDQDGQVLSKAIFKDGRPYDGTIYKNSYGNWQVTPYKQGNKDGVEMIYDKYVKPAYLSEKFYYTKGQLTKKEGFKKEKLISEKHYKDGQVHGIDAEYKLNGDIVYKMEYKEGKPYQGEKLQYYYDYSRLLTYDKGKLIRIDYNQVDENNNYSILIAKDLIDNNRVNRTIYKPNGDFYCKYSLLDYQLDGTCVYYEDNSPKYTASFEKGEFISGTVLFFAPIKDDYYGRWNKEEPTTYTKLQLEGNKIVYQIYDLATNELDYSFSGKIEKANKRLDPFMNQAEIKYSDLYGLTKMNSMFNSLY
ncbi:toxin-antitoxin system YwqK family antitoxin [Myroides pelagicus]|uniref:Toxin-antitoxin system YwqK family antitoxin n=1 Tax=Myroides pelagicus TaxID=270914 RepID=A0A7K1GSN4_9FLAO|nr:hypothetical protein [Myroides pelagicus]MTH30864.1 hypothetical protein [Myroides pelagicus]